MTTNAIIPFVATHPGTLIRDELEVRDDITQTELATLLGVKPSFLNEIIRGKRPVTADISILLEKALGIPADYWMRFQSQYEIDTARAKEKNKSKLKLIDIWNTVSLYVPVKEFKKKGYLGNELSSNIAIIQDIYDVQSLEELEYKYKDKKFAFFKKSTKLQVDDKNMIAWIVLVEYEAGKKLTNSFELDKLSQLKKELQEIFYKNADVFRSVEETLTRYGIKFVLVDKLEKTPIDGYSFWSENNPVIALTLRHSRIDNFAFTLLHELGHIALHLARYKEEKFLDLTEMDENETEHAANNYAQDALIPKECWEELKHNNAALTDEKIYEFSDKYRIHPAIILGRICFESSDYVRKASIDKKIY